MRVRVQSQREMRKHAAGRVRRRLLRALRILGGAPVALKRRAVSTRPARAARGAVERVVPSALIHDSQMRAVAIGWAVGIAHVAYAGLNVVTGLVTRSTWTFSVGVLIALLNVGKSYVASGAMAGGALKGAQGESTLALKRYRNAGIGLILLILAMSGTVVQLVIAGPGYAYPGALIYAYATYALVQIVVAVVNQVRARHDERLAVMGVRMFNLANALISVFALQTALLSHISWETLPAMVTRKAAETLAGGAVCFVMIAMGTLLARSAVQRLAERRSVTAKTPRRREKSRR